MKPHRSNSFLTVPLLALLSIYIAGCAGYTVKPGADPAVVAAEAAQEQAVDVFDAFLKWERNNETVVSAEVHEWADFIREFGPGWIDEAAKATRAYKAARTDENLASLNAAKAVLDAVIAEARRHIATKGAQ